MEVLTSNPNNKTTINSEIYNVIMPEGLRGVIIDDLGEKNLLCIGVGSPATLD
jgi:hypothetical protein